ncbi:LOW QUALITY PROTEIN: galactosylgalactosylxylosylprotein 3-beta-glucuronosyltransferase I-like [Homalodisca vitripennis]|uniref:LOW QUALITY PROTEIN: galactosylgalactosylxylosylprotein 3-beta-glucuronosyltransferase I-like n=1 Tax=Homalodisca vitripennis TaxID=197043 RepID=UPI001EEC2D74|nr:LOW QUALITY PROTEIN: galactosylgalactosylxylosylprotein 3-beta-glucuronosyltransferase I-like [Homalodisca vitripennis]
MPIRKKIVLYILLLLLVLLWFIGVKNRDPNQYDNMKRTLELYEYQLRESKEHMAETMKMLGRRDCVVWDAELPVIYAITTPTFARRPVQKAELTRLSHTLMLVQNLHWIVVEDSDHKTALVTNLLTDSRLNFTHLNEPTPAEWKHKPKEPNWVKPRGVLQRNRALAWLRDNLNPDTDRGVVYFVDDDNSYSLQIFSEMRFTKEVSVWPVGLVGGLLVEKPVVNETTGRVVGWNSQWRPERPFPIDMAGFAINLQHLLRHPQVKFQLQVKGGWQESELLTHLTTKERLEPLADGCTKVYVWHTRTEAPKLNMEDKLIAKGKPSNKGIEV